MEAAAPPLPLLLLLRLLAASVLRCEPGPAGGRVQQLQVHIGQEQIMKILARGGQLELSEEGKDVPSPDSSQLELLNWKKHLWRVLPLFS